MFTLNEELVIERSNEEEMDYEWALDRASYIQKLLNSNKELTEEEINILNSELKDILDIIEGYEYKNSPTWNDIMEKINRLDNLKLENKELLAFSEEENLQKQDDLQKRKEAIKKLLNKYNTLRNFEKVKELEEELISLEEKGE